MRKLYTILSTILLFTFLTSRVHAVNCSRVIGRNDLSIRETQLYYLDNSGLHTDGVIYPPNTYLDLVNINYLMQVNLYFNQLQSSGKYMQFTGNFYIENRTPNSFDNIFPLAITSPEPILSTGYASSYCESVGGTANATVTRMYDSNNNAYVVATYPYSVKCYNPNNEPIIGLKFTPNYGSNANLDFHYTMRVSAYANSEYTYYDGDYDYEFCQLQNAIENISINSSGATSSDIQNQTQQIINNNNENTQQIIDNQNDIYIQKDCTTVTCNNLLDMSTVNGLSAKGITYTYDNDSDTLLTTGTYNQWTQPNSLQTNVVLEQGKTYYVSINQPLNERLYLFKGGVSGSTEWFNVGQTSLTFTSNVSGPLFIQLRESVSNFRIMVFTESNQEYCRYGSTEENCDETNRLDNINNSISDVNNTINNSDVSQGNSKMEDIIENFEAPDYGFAEFIYLPFNFFRLILNPVCQPIQLHVPYVTKNDTITLPCYNTILQQNFPSLMTLIHIVTDGLIVYYCCVTIFRTAQNVLDPEKANLEVFDL